MPKKARPYRHLQRAQRDQLAEARLAEAHFAVVVAEVDAETLERQPKDERTDGYEQAVEERKRALAAAKRNLAVHKGRRGKLSRPEQRKLKQRIDAYVEEQLRSAAGVWETNRFNHELRLSELEAIPERERAGDWEDEERSTKLAVELYGTMAEIAHERLPAASEENGGGKG